MSFLDWLEGKESEPAPEKGVDLVMFFVPRHEFEALAEAGAKSGLSPQQALSRAVAEFLERQRAAG